MLLFLTAVLILSSLALFVLLYVKHWELSTGRMMLSGARPHVERAATRFLKFFEVLLPRAARRLLQIVMVWMRIQARDVVVRMLIAIERTLEAALEMLQRGVAPARGATAAASSAFLREVAEHKRKLTRTARVRKPKSVQDSTSAEVQSISSENTVG